jgi:hypothetical protein
MIKESGWKMSPQSEMTEVLNQTQFPAGPAGTLPLG